MRRRMAAGNWKMNGLRADLAEIAAIAALRPDCEMVLCPPATLIAPAAAALGAGGAALALGGQDCAARASGAHTGDISAEMLADAGASHVILGHSERRADHGEGDKLVAAKVAAAWEAGLVAIVCIGETEAERAAGRTLSVLAGQLARSIPDHARAGHLGVAYEPVWAIGSGRTPSPQEVQDVHAALRQGIETRFGADVAAAVRLLYGGSVKPENAAGLMSLPDVDGALVGGASLRAESFAAIVAAIDAA
ncbi:MAG: triose-phosphate isomerase [Rhodobacteraceae bacterium]|nr:triose-phosphate isomerase [Paracoccaceae bacterium]